MPNEKQLGTSISEMSNFIKNSLTPFCTEEGGVAVVAENINEKLMTGWNNVVGPKCLIAFVGEDAYGEESIQDLLSYVRRHFDIIVQRGKILGEPRNTALTNTTGPSRAFYDQVEDIRDILRNLIFPTPMIVNPIEYHGVKPAGTEGWMLDSYIISISMICQLGRPSFEAPEIEPNTYIQLGIGSPQFNKIPTV